MLGHFSASSLPEAVVTWRQLLPPYPSSKASVAFFGPHHEGVSASATFEQPTAMTVTAAASASFCLSKNFMFSSSVQVGFSLLDGVYGPAKRVNADTKTQGQ